MQDLGKLRRERHRETMGNILKIKEESLRKIKIGKVTKKENKLNYTGFFLNTKKAERNCSG